LPYQTYEYFQDCIKKKNIVRERLQELETGAFVKTDNLGTLKKDYIMFFHDKLQNKLYHEDDLIEKNNKIEIYY